MTAAAVPERNKKRMPYPPSKGKKDDKKPKGGFKEAFAKRFGKDKAKAAMKDAPMMPMHK